MLAVFPPGGRDFGATRLLLHYVSAVIKSDALESTTLRDLVVAHVYDLVALAVAPKDKVIADGQRRGLAAARLCAIKSDILANLTENGLTESAISRRHRLSPRYL